MNNTVILAVLLCAINLALIQAFKIKTILLHILTIHVFLFLLAFFSDLYKRKLLRLKKTIPLYLLSINFLRILACVVFLSPTILNYESSDKSYIYNFFICYFIYLFYDIIFKSKNWNKINR